MIILRDTSEKKPWEFRDFEVKDISLETGDYTIEGFESQLCIERKGSITEFAGNLFQKRFKRELDRMLEFKYKFVVLECGMNELIDFPRGTDIPYYKQKYIKAKGPTLLVEFIKMMQKYNTIQFVFCSTREAAQTTARSIMKRVYNGEI